jgi:hypothetical protein
MTARAFLPAAAVILLGGCGYHVAGHSNLVPAKIHTIAIPAFGNVTTRYKLTDRLPSAIGRELLSRTRYRIVADPREADAILSGAVINFLTNPTVFDPATGRASGVQVNVYLQITLKEQGSGKVIYYQPNMEFRQRYEISADPRAFFDESDPALERLSQDVARTVVSGILSSF